ncbi:putative intracellular protein transport protein (UsoA) [Aspergillus clavatus NRRL 1]|uniref:Intracellular protein transport protein (UsoA), putative n=1 Tax=Aspergillus clavatus (strain ATCC 1007 / CBS 513.65 / DSM 816 / NCTC 3887 / NRRL 1 / QM 1276 / 107) TaxID=344612 RepID=A1CP87_ASPCL|nr:intracellular protein transport protein (UsoA), putative [Aspergillus clavatus NRRL 1]EAW07458.1 intracellular protein transport protein (UsoA), putative [Aspergillus clavatus NRRL 1]
MFRILESQAPAKQTATDTINTLSSRLQSATLLEDRRAAIQGLRSFSKIYPASVASGALRPLISSLRNDREDVDTIKVVLETLLMLFSPDESSPEASDEIALWLADEFTQRQDNITALLDLLDTRDFYSRLYSLQLMFQISSARPERTQECILTAPLGIPRLVGAMGDSREPIRNEALLLLIALTPASEEFQKLVAFENAFDVTLSLIENEGGLTHGLEVVEDCLSLLANLLRLNVSNQSHFRETGCIKRLAKLLADVNKDEDSTEDAAQWAHAQRDKNIWGLLVIIQLFLVKGGVNTPANQTAFWNNGVMEQVLSAAFGQKFNVNVTSKALATCADLIRGNSSLQERFADIEVTWGRQSNRDEAANGDKAHHGVQRVNVIEALLKLSLEPASIQVLDARLAACECIKAFFANHVGIRVHVLRRAIDGHISGQDQIPNILSVLLVPPEARGNADPYQVWIASVLMFHLVFDNAEAKAVAMEVTEGDAESGEEVITCIQTIVGNLITGIQRGDDERITIGYLMLLCGWLFEEPDAVNDFLGEGSSIQTLLQETKHRGVSNVLVSGLSTILLGILYEFSTKDSPIPRATLYKLLIEQMGREQFIDKITRLRESPLVRDFEVLPQTVGGLFDAGLPEIFFDRTFIDFLKDNFGRLIRAIDREPGFEVSIITNGVQRGISRELVDSLRADLEERSELVQKLESDILSLRNKFEQEQIEHRKTKELSSSEASKIQQINASLQRHHEQELSALEEQHQHAKKELLKQHGEQLRAIDNQLKESSAEYERRSQKMKQLHDAEVADLHKKIRSLESQLAHVKEENSGHVGNLQTTIQSLKSEADQLRERHSAEVRELQSLIESLRSELDESKAKHADHISDLKTATENLQSELATARKEHETEVADLKAKNETLQAEHNTKISDVQAKAQSLQSELESAMEKSKKDLQVLHDDYSSKCSKLENQAEDAKSRVKKAEADAHKSEEALRELQAQLEKARAEAKEKEEARKAAQSELEDLLIVFGDLEAKRNQDKKRLKDLGQEVSEAEDDEEEEEDEDEE